MSFAHLTLPTRDVERTTVFFERTLGYARKPVPANSPIEAQWLDIGLGQEMHIFYTEDFVTGPYEGEFGRHVAVLHPLAEFETIKARLAAHGAVIFDPLRPTPFERFFFREPINGYVFEVIDQDRGVAPRAIHLDQ